MVDRRRLKRSLARVVSALATLWVIATLSFLLVRLAPGDPARPHDPSTGPEVRQETRALYGLDQPLASRYAAWMTGLARGRLGWSFHYRRPVVEVVAGALGPTLVLASMALSMQYLAALLIALLVAPRQRPTRRTIDALAAVLSAVPTFWLGLVALRWPGRGWGWFPTWGARSEGVEHFIPAILDLVGYALLPAAVLAAANAGVVYQLTERSLRQSLASPWALGARARGLSRRRLLWRHGMRSAAGRAAQRLGIDLPALVSGSLVIEVLFSRPGLGRIAHQAYLARDYPLLTAGATAAGGLVVVGSLIADGLHSVLVPKTSDGENLG